MREFRNPNKSHFRGLMALVFPAILLICSGCSKDGSVRVVNNTDHNVTVSIMQGENQVILPGTTLTETVKISKGFLPPSEREIEVAGSGIVKTEFSVRMTVKDGEEAEFAVEADAAGLIIINELTCTTREAFIKKCEVGQWGGNQLTYHLRPEGMRSFRLEPGCFDVRINSVPCPDNVFSRDYLEMNFQLGEVDTIRFRLTDN